MAVLGTSNSPTTPSPKSSGGGSTASSSNVIQRLTIVLGVGFAVIAALPSMILVGSVTHSFFVRGTGSIGDLLVALVITLLLATLITGVILLVRKNWVGYILVYVPLIFVLVYFVYNPAFPFA